MKQLITGITNKFASQNFRNFLKILSVDSLVKVSGIILLPVYLSLMTQDEFGLYGYLIAMVAYLASLLNGGLYLIQSKLYFEQAEAKREEVVSTLNILLFGILTFLIIILVSFELDQSFFINLFKHPFDYSLFRFPLLTGIFATAYSLMITYYFLASRSIKKLQLFNLLRSIIIHVTALGLLYLLPQLDGSYIRIAASYYTELGIIVIVVVIFYKSMTFHFNMTIAKRALILAFPITLYSMLSLIIFISDRFFIEQIGTMKDLAIYNLAWVLAGVIPFISNSIHSIWLPELLSEKNNKALWGKAKSMVTKLLLGFTLISICTLAGVKILLMLSIISDKYEEVLPILPIVLFGSMLLSIFQLVFNFLLTISRISILVYISFCVALMVLWIPEFLVMKWGVYGAAVSMVIMNISLLIPGVLYCFYFYKKHPEKLTLI